ncbi:MAG: iron ABC transporter permease [Marinobacter sp.]|nr:iron ABC transporter permease [Marinobacter sp.]
MSKALIFRGRQDGWSVRVHPQLLAVCLGLLLLLCLSVLTSLSLGSHPTRLPDVVRVLLGADSLEGIRLILLEIRLPRVLVAVLAGGALGVAGLILQGLVRNPLASPDVIGVTSGASTAAVFTLWLTGSAGTTSLLVPAAIAGAFGVTVLLVALTWKGGVSPTRLVLIGIGLAAGLSAITTLLLVISPDATAMTAYIWLTGSLYASRWGDVIGLSPIFITGLILACAVARHLDLQALGDDLALAAGSNLNANRLVQLLLAVLLAGSAVAYTGALSFIGLLAPHMARRLVRTGHTGLTLMSALLGGLILVWADLAGRFLFMPRDLPAGLFVAGVGAPFFVFLLYRLRRQG